MATWTDGPLLGFDTETTGVNPFSDRIVSAALVGRGRAGTVARTWLIDPGVEIPEQAAAIHGITTAHARAHGTSPRRALEEISGELVAAFSAHVPVVAYNAPFDLTILERELERHHLPTVGEQLGSPLGPVLDPLVLDRGVDGTRRGTRRLVDLCGHYDVTERGRLHTADVDVSAALDVLLEQARRHPGLAGASLAELQGWQSRTYREWAARRSAQRAEEGLAHPTVDPGWPLATAVRSA